MATPKYINMEASYLSPPENEELEIEVFESSLYQLFSINREIIRDMDCELCVSTDSIEDIINRYDVFDTRSEAIRSEQ